MTKIIRSLHVKTMPCYLIIFSLLCLLTITSTAQTTCTSNNSLLCDLATTDAGASFTANGTTTISTSGTTFTFRGPNNTDYSGTSGFYQVTTAGCIATKFKLQTDGTIFTTSSVTATSTTGTTFSCTISSVDAGQYACVQICDSRLVAGMILNFTLNFTGNLNGPKLVVISEFSVLNMAPALGPTPVSILNFDYQLKNCGVALKWSTAQETNSKEFVVQNSTDGINWTKVGNVKAQGMSGIQKNYSFVHPNPEKGQNFYRFAAVDLDGSMKYSDVLSPTINCGKTEISVHPNPFTEFVNVYFTALRSGNATITLRDNAGKSLYNSSHTVHSGSNTIRLDKLFNLPKGVYIISVNTDDGISNQKLIK